MPQAPELIVILLVALIVFGPSRLPAFARQLGDWTRNLRQAARELRQGIEAEVEQTGLRTEIKEISTQLSQSAQSAQSPESEPNPNPDPSHRPHQWVGPEPKSGPTATDAHSDLEIINEVTPTPSPNPPAPTDPDQPETHAGAETRSVDHETAKPAVPPPQPDLPESHDRQA